MLSVKIKGAEFFPELSCLPRKSSKSTNATNQRPATHKRGEVIKHDESTAQGISNPSPGAGDALEDKDEGEMSIPEGQTERNDASVKIEIDKPIFADLTNAGETKIIL